MKAQPFPDIAGLANWKSHLYTACLEASNVTDPRPVVQWLQAVDVAGATFESFIESGRGFERLDFRLAAALKRVCSATGVSATCRELYKTISQEENLAINQRRVLTGRQILWMILRTFKTNADLGVVYSIYHFQNVKWRGDDLRQMEAFRNEWNTIVHHQAEPLSDNQLAELLLRVVEHSSLLRNDLADYLRRMHETRHPDYKALLAMLDRHISMKREKENDQSLFDHMKKQSGGGAAPGRKTATPATREQSNKREKRPCKFHGTPAGCNRGKDCPFSHAGGGRQQSAGPGGRAPNPRGRSSSPAVQNPAALKAKLCLKYAIGECKATAESCKYGHRSTKAEEKDAVERFRKRLERNRSDAKSKTQSRSPSPKPKAKPKAKSALKTTAPVVTPVLALAALVTRAASFCTSAVAFVCPAPAMMVLPAQTCLGRTSSLTLGSVEVIRRPLSPGEELRRSSRGGLTSRGDGNQECWGNPDIAAAEAFRRARNLALDSGTPVPFGWPVCWTQETALLYYPVPGRVGGVDGDPDPENESFDLEFAPEVLPRQEAIETLTLQPQNVRAVFHVGLVPECFREYARQALRQALSPQLLVHSSQCGGPVGAAALEVVQHSGPGGAAVRKRSRKKRRGAGTPGRPVGGVVDAADPGSDSSPIAKTLSARCQ